MFSFLKHHYNAEMVCDPSDSDIEESQFPAEDWSHTVYSESEVPVPKDRHEEKVLDSRFESLLIPTMLKMMLLVDLVLGLLSF